MDFKPINSYITMRKTQVIFLQNNMILSIVIFLLFTFCKVLRMNFCCTIIEANSCIKFHYILDFKFQSYYYLLLQTCLNCLVFILCYL